MKALDPKVGSPRIADISFPERLAEAMGAREVVAHEINPVARQESVRFVNGLPRRSRSRGGFEAPASSVPREVAIARLLAAVDRSEAPPAQLRLVELLEARNATRGRVRQSVLENGWSERETF